MDKKNPNHQASYDALIALPLPEIKRRVIIQSYTDAHFVASEVLVSLLRKGFEKDLLSDCVIAELYRRLFILVTAYFNKNPTLARVRQRNSVEDVVQFAWTALLGDARPVSFAEQRFLLWVEARAADFVRLYIRRTRGETSWQLETNDDDETPLDERLMGDLDDGPEDALLREKISEHLTQMWLEMERKTSMAVYLRLEMEYEWKKVAACLKCSVPTARKLYAAGIEQLKGAME